MATNDGQLDDGQEDDGLFDDGQLDGGQDPYEWTWDELSRLSQPELAELRDRLSRRMAGNICRLAQMILGRE